MKFAKVKVKPGILTETPCKKSVFHEPLLDHMKKNKKIHTLGEFSRVEIIIISFISII